MGQIEHLQQMHSGDEAIVVIGAHCLLDGAFEEATVVVADGRIAEIRSEAGRPDPAALTLDGHGLVLAPAIVDVHGDAFERQVMPRPGVFAPLDVALIETDRQLAANGITTAYHALTLSWEPDLRGIGQARDMIRALERLSPALTIENRVQLRWETFAFEALELIEEALASPLLPSIAFNDHTSMTLLDPSVRLQDRPFELSPDFPARSPEDPAILQKVSGLAKRSGLSADEYVDTLASVWARRVDVGGMIDRVAELGRNAGAPMLSHDDSHPATRAHFRDLGARVAEFPMGLGAVEAAREAGDLIVFGAPNAMRGGSHIGSPSAGDMIEAGFCDALASDYYYPALPAALARLDRERRAPRAALWSLVSQGPAQAMGLQDRGRIEAGLRADLVLLDWPAEAAPAVRATIFGGTLAYLAQPRGGAPVLR